jgi:predicted RNA methylase
MNTNSPEFTKWFKGSVVTDNNGNPLRLYHGTNRTFDKFAVGDDLGWGAGIYLTDNPIAAREFGDKVLHVYASIKNPVYEKELRKFEASIRKTKAWQKAIKNEIEYQLRRWGVLKDDEENIDLDYSTVLQEDFAVINEALRELGYDGIIANRSNNIEGNEYVAFYSDQVIIAKSDTRTNPAPEPVYYRDHAIRIYPEGNFTIELDYDQYESTPEPRSRERAMYEAKSLIDTWYKGNMHQYRENQAAAPSLHVMREQRYRKLVSLYAMAVAAGKIKSEFQNAIEQEFANLGQQIALNFKEIYEQRPTRPTTTVSAKSGKSDSESQKRTQGESGTESVSEQTQIRDRPGRPGQRSTARPSDVTADQKDAQKVNYSLRTAADLRLTRKKRLEYNRAAADLLKQNRAYTAQEKQILSLYTGHGGLMSVDVGVLNQHYTRYSVSRFMWAALLKLGFKGGWVLEPGCGVGNFIGTKPDDTNVLAFDYDAIAAQVASTLYPLDDVRQADIRTFDFSTHQSYIVGAIGNPPFGNYSRYSRNDTFAALKPKIHDHFILKMLETIQPGGLVAVISSTGTMDKRNGSVREAMLEMAHFLGAYRLPNSTFEANASTTVTTDVMFFQKRDQQRNLSERDRLFAQASAIPNSDAAMSDWYQKNQGYILGTLDIGGGMYQNQIGVRGKLDEDQLKELLATFPFKALEKVPDPIAQPANLNAKHKVSYPDEAASANSILFILKQLVGAQKELAANSQKAAIRADLKKAIAEHIKKYGWFEKSKIIQQFFAGSPDYNQLRAIARPGQTKSDIKYSDIVEKDTIYTARYAPKLKTDRAADIVLYCRQTGLRSDAEVMRSIAELSEKQFNALIERDADVFLDPANGEYKIRPEYIAGNLKDKIVIAQQAGLQKNVEALQAKLPKRKSINELSLDIIDVNTYLPVDIAKAYVKYATGGDLMGTKRHWAIPAYDKDLSEMSGWGWKADYAVILELYINGDNYPKQRVKDDATDEEKAKATSDQTINNNKMRRMIPKRFTEWLVEIADEEIKQAAVNAWNDTYNVTIEPDYTGSTFSCASMGATWTNGKPFEPRAHQKKWVEKALLVGSGINSHGVGAGKTLSAILLAGVMKERGIARKPMFVVPNKVVEKWIAEFEAAFPGANVLNLKTDRANKELGLSMAQQNDYDAVFVTHEGFKAIPNSPELQEEYFNLRIKTINDDIETISSQLTANEIADAMANATAAKGSKKKALKNPLQKRLKELLLNKMKMEQKIKLALEGSKLESIYFDELGVDAIIVDEAHNFKNLFLSAKAVELQIGVASSSDRAEEAFAKFHYINKQMGNRNVFLLTATPTNNTPLEAYILLQAVAPKYLGQLKIDNVDSFIDQYARLETVETADMLGNFKTKMMVTGYINLDSLRKIFNRYVEFLDTSDFPEVKAILPIAKYNPVYLDPAQRDHAIITHLNARVKDIVSRQPMQIQSKSSGEPNPTTIYMWPVPVHALPLTPLFTLPIPCLPQTWTLKNGCIRSVCMMENSLMI